MSENVNILIEKMNQEQTKKHKRNASMSDDGGTVVDVGGNSPKSKVQQS